MMIFIDAMNPDQIERDLLSNRKEKEFVFKKSIQMKRFKVASIRNDYYDEHGKHLRTQSRWCWYVESWAGKKIFSNVSGHVRYFRTPKLAKQNFISYLRKGMRQTL